MSLSKAQSQDASQTTTNSSLIKLKRRLTLLQEQTQELIQMQTMGVFNGGPKAKINSGDKDSSCSSGSQLSTNMSRC